MTSEKQGKTITYGTLAKREIKNIEEKYSTFDKWELSLLFIVIWELAKKKYKI